jgi:hypothetical protein
MRILPLLIPILLPALSIAEESDSILFKLSVHGPIAELARCLEKGKSVNTRRYDGLTLLCAAVQANNRSTVMFLLEHGADASIADTMNFDPLYWALHKGFFPIADLLLKHGVDVDRPNSQGNSPLISAVMRGDLAAANFLLEHGADRMWKSSAGLTPMAIASQNNDKSMINLLSLFASAGKNLPAAQPAEAESCDAGCRFTDANAFFAAVKSGRRSFRSCSLRGIDLMGMRLSGIDFHGANLSGCDLRGADMRYCDLCCAVLRNAFLHGTDFRNARVDKADFGNTILTKADLRDVEGLSCDQLRSSLNLYKTKLDTETVEIMKYNYPRLFKDPGGAWNYQVKAGTGSP